MTGELHQRGAFWREEYLRLLESLPDAVFTVDLAGHIAETNPAAERFTGQSRAELLSCNFHDLLTAHSRPVVREMVRTAMAETGEGSCEAEFRLSDGEIRRVRLHSAVQRDGARVTVRHLLRELPAASAEQEPSLRLMAKNLAEMILTYDMRRRLIFANPAVETLTGYSVEELERSQFICWIHPDDRPRMLGNWDQLFNGKSYHDEEYRLITKDGRMKWALASWSPVLDDDGKQVGVQGHERDITQRKMAEAARQHSDRTAAGSEHDRALFESSPFPMWEEDFSAVRRYLDSLRDGGAVDMRARLMADRAAVEECLGRVRILDVNRAARDFYGAGNREEMLDSLQHLFDEKAFEVFRDEIATLWEKRVFRTEFETRTLTGDYRLVNMIVVVVDSANEDWSRVIVSFFDVTDRKRLEEEFVQSQKMESLGRMAGGIAHDFNNLLTVINGYSEFLLQQVRPEDPLRAGLSHIKSAGEHCADLTQQLLAFSRKQVVKRRPLNLNDLIAESQGVFKGVLGDAVELVVRLEPELHLIEADRGQMHQVLMNLVVNAREAMPHGGRLTVETSNIHQEHGHRVGGEEGSPFVQVEIRDTGLGMDERTRQHLFEPFFTTKKTRKSTGLGLATVFGIVTQNGGHIEVNSQPGEGALFRIQLPKMAGAAHPVAEPQRSSHDFTGSGTVLVVDDREDVRRLACHMMEDLGYQVIPAGGGVEALALAGEQAHPIGLLLTDVIMPGMNGRELADQLAGLHPEMKIIFMSGYTDQIINESTSYNARSAYLQKPFTRAELVAALRKTTA